MNSPAQQDSPRLFARKMARELSREEISLVAGGFETAPSIGGGPYCFKCTIMGGSDVETYEKD